MTGLETSPPLARAAVLEPPPEGRAPRQWVRWVAVAVWLLYLLAPMQVLLHRAPDWQQTVGIAALVAFAVGYVVGLVLGMWRAAGLSNRQWGLGARFLHLGVLVVLAALVVPGAGPAALTTAVFVAAAAVATLPRWAGIAVWTVAFLAVVAAGQLSPRWSAAGDVAIAVFLAGLAVLALRLAGERRDALLCAQRELHEFAVVEERDRIARDLHDILGHSLTVLALKAELAERLVDVDPERARAELTCITELTREALADVRATTRRQRGGSLAGEIAAARMALDTAGIAAELPSTTDGIPPRLRELFAWTIREGVTNVVRHSGATRCRISLSGDRLEIDDDGGGPRTPRSDSRGLAGIRDRAAAAGACVQAGPNDDGPGYRLTVSMATVGGRP